MLFNPGDLEKKEFKVITFPGEAGEQVALWYACQSAAFGAFLWNQAVNQAYASKAEIDQALEREILKIMRENGQPDKDLAMRRMIVRSGLFNVADNIRQELLTNQPLENFEGDG